MNQQLSSSGLARAALHLGCRGHLGALEWPAGQWEQPGVTGATTASPQVLHALGCLWHSACLLQEAISASQSQGLLYPELAQPQAPLLKVSYSCSHPSLPVAYLLSRL